MFIRLILIDLVLFIHSSFSLCPYIRTSLILTDCIFDSTTYLLLGAQISHGKSIDFLAHYSLNQSFDQPLIYHLNERWMFLVPLLLKCSNHSIEIPFTECQYTMRLSRSPLSSMVEYMTTQLTVMNISHLGRQSVLFLPAGEISLRSCKAYDCSRELVYLTASNDTFHFQITYEKPTGTACQSDLDCSDRFSLTNLMQCDQESQTCQCADENITTIDINGIGRLCTDSIDRTNCSQSPQRCLHWCNQSSTSFCTCPSSTRKVRRVNGLFDCELEPTGYCRLDDDEIRKCPTGTFCHEDRCRPLTLSRQVFDTSTTPSFTTIITATTFIPRLAPSFLRTLILIISIIIFLFFVIVCFILMLIKARRLHLLTSSAASSSFVQSMSTGISTDFPHEIYQYPSKLTDSQRTSFLPGLVPQANLSPRFYRPYQDFDQRRVPLCIQSPTLSVLQTPRLTRLENGDVLISA